MDAVFINIKTGNPRYSGDGSFLAYNLSQIKPDVLVALYSEEKLEAGLVFDCCCDEYFRLPFDNRVLQRVVKRLQYLFELLQYKRLSVNRSMMIKLAAHHDFPRISVENQSKIFRFVIRPDIRYFGKIHYTRSWKRCASG